jgi:hypothetical protein
MAPEVATDIMISAAISYNVKVQLKFVGKGFKIDSKHY